MSRHKNPLTPVEGRALREAAKKPKLGAPIATSKDVGRLEVRPATAKRLVVKGFAKIIAGRLIITPEGERAVNKPTPAPVVYLREGDGLTARRELAVKEEGAEVIDPHTLKPFWKEQAALAKANAEAELEDRRKHARQVSRSVRRWPTTPTHVSPVRMYFAPDQKRAA